MSLKKTTAFADGCGKLYLKGRVLNSFKLEIQSILLAENVKLPMVFDVYLIKSFSGIMANFLMIRSNSKNCKVIFRDKYVIAIKRRYL